MMTNATLSAWQKRTANDRYGQPTRTTQDGSWRVLAEPLSKRLKIAGRDVVSSLRVHLQFANLPEIAVGDKVSISSVAYQVLQADTTTHATLGHLTLLLG